MPSNLNGSPLSEQKESLERMRNALTKMNSGGWGPRAIQAKKHMIFIFGGGLVANLSAWALILNVHGWPVKNWPYLLLLTVGMMLFLGFVAIALASTETPASWKGVVLKELATYMPVHAEKYRTLQTSTAAAQDLNVAEVHQFLLEEEASVTARLRTEERLPPNRSLFARFVARQI